ncbi:uncharacterized protein LOC113351752 [Papaver somniferum]|uniref:uncharacterized protein LOC113351752 n=1 Tax=Papaver somniferum TaxID=3469 RepID=UPI000E7048EB|nr:uncharacterized protein LOC113351752 [Papaver somniferum]
MERDGLYAGYRLNRWSPFVSHLMFTDNVMLFGILTNDNIAAVNTILQNYSTWSGQQVNYNKSAVSFSKGVASDMQQDVITALGVKQMEIEDKFLGVYILKPSYRCNSHEYLIDKFDNKLAVWKKEMLSHAGRTTLIQAVLALIPLLHIINKLSQTIRNFWWGHSREQKKLHYIKWDWFISNKNKGGLGLRSLENLNKELVVKLAWRFINDTDSLWSSLLRAKYLRNSNFQTVKKPQRCSSTWSALLSVRTILSEGVLWSIGDGSSVKIWSDPWVPKIQGFKPSNPLQLPVNISRVCDLIIHNERKWNESLIHQLFSPYESAQILGIRIFKNPSPDKLVWTLTSHEISLKSCLQRWLLASDDDYAFYLGACLLWAIWKARNNLIYEKNNISIEVIIRDGMYWFNKFYYYEEVSNGDMSTRSISSGSQNVMTQWCAPPTGKIKINVDVACKGDRASCAVVARDWHGNHLCSETMILPHDSPVITEANGFLLAANLASRMNFNQVILEGYSITVV